MISLLNILIFSKPAATLGVKDRAREGTKCSPACTRDKLRVICHYESRCRKDIELLAIPTNHEYADQEAQRTRLLHLAHECQWRARGKQEPPDCASTNVALGIELLCHESVL